MAWSSEWPPIMRTPLGASAMRARSRACICVDVVEERQLAETMTEVSDEAVKRFMNLQRSLHVSASRRSPASTFHTGNLMEFLRAQ